jgi:PadR family transcriptional regulator, regulatory protein PadR
MSREEGAGRVVTDLLQGTLDLLILKTLQAGPRHGWDIAQRIQQVSKEALRVGQG